MTTTILALAASSRPDSLNKRLLALAIAEATKAGATVTELSYAACDAPLYDGQDAVALPSGAQTLSDALRAHDGLLLASPEYNWSMPGALKNLVDWLSIDPKKPLRGRTGLLLCASPSVRGGVIGLQQLRVPLEHLGMVVYPHTVGVGDANTLIGEHALTNRKEQKFFTTCVHDFVRITGALKG